MLRSILNAFAHSYGRTMGRHAANRTRWLAIPMLILVIFIGLAEARVVPDVLHLLPILHPFR